MTSAIADVYPFAAYDQNTSDIQLLREQLQDMNRRLMLLMVCNTLLMAEHNGNKPG